MPARRAVLATICAGLAGCVESTRTPARNTTRQTRETGATRTTSGPLSFGERGDRVRPTAARVQSSVRHLRQTDHNGLLAGDQWYLFVTVEPTDGGPDPSEFTLHTATDEHPSFATRYERLREQIAYVNGRAYDQSTTGWLLFSIPYDDPIADARLAGPNSSWRLPAEAVERLRSEPPAFELGAVKPPARPPADEPFDVSLAVTNDGGAGTFRWVFNYTAPLYAPAAFDARLDAGGDRTVRATVEVHTDGSSASDETVAARVRSPGGNGEWSVTLA